MYFTFVPTDCPCQIAGSMRLGLQFELQSSVRRTAVFKQATVTFFETVSLQRLVMLLADIVQVMKLDEILCNYDIN
jgi:hypothetical protein